MRRSRNSAFRSDPRPMETTYILTAEMDDESFAWLDGLRREHFPPDRNFLSAHLTLFHRLSPAQVERLRLVQTPCAPIELRFDRIVFLGFGVALGVRSAELKQLRNKARAEMGGEFSRQDSQPWMPHVTVQNKATADWDYASGQPLSPKPSGVWRLSAIRGRVGIAEIGSRSALHRFLATAARRSFFGNPGKQVLL